MFFSQSHNVLLYHLSQTEENFQANLIDLEASVSSHTSLLFVVLNGHLLSIFHFQCKIRDWGLLIKCGVVSAIINQCSCRAFFTIDFLIHFLQVLAIIILLFFLHSIPELNLSIGWTALRTQFYLTKASYF